MIPVTKPFLPPREEYDAHLEGIWTRNWLTNMGPLSTDLENKLSQYLSVDHLLYVNNGTIALQMAIKALELKGEIITTPFSFVATTSSIVWEGCTPVFADICADTLNIDPATIEELITEDTSAILATHVYGNPCDVQAIEKIAIKYGLKVIYDGAHAFGVTIAGKSIFEFGDISTCSLHATKLYHSIEGGLIVTKNIDLYQKLRSMRNFGFSGVDSFNELGINGKNSEFHAAMGLVNLNYIEAIHTKREALTLRYIENLKQLRAYSPSWHPYSKPNYAYLPLVFQNEELALYCFEKLKQQEIFARRYFYPSLASSLPYVAVKSLPITDDISKRVLCLPLYFDLSVEEVDLICDTLLKAQNLFLK